MHGLTPTPATRVFRNGRIYTVDASRSWAEAVAVRNGRIAYVGSNAGAAPFIGPDTVVNDLNGQMMLPGFFDCHVHLASGGLQELECNLTGIKSKGDVLNALQSCIVTLRYQPSQRQFFKGQSLTIISLNRLRIWNKQIRRYLL